MHKRRRKRNCYFQNLCHVYLLVGFQSINTNVYGVFMTIYLNFIEIWTRKKPFFWYFKKNNIFRVCFHRLWLRCLLPIEFYQKTKFLVDVDSIIFYYLFWLTSCKMNRKTYRVLILTNTTQIKRKNNTSQEKTSK